MRLLPFNSNEFQKLNAQALRAKGTFNDGELAVAVSFTKLRPKEGCNKLWP